MTDAKTKRWLKLALDDNVSQRAAAREVGMPCGVPSRKAKELLDAAQRFQKLPEAAEWIPSQLEVKRKELERKRKAATAIRHEIKDLERLIEVMEVLR